MFLEIDLNGILSYDPANPTVNTVTRDFINACAGLITTHHLDGLDLDWEGQNANYSKYHLFVKDLRNAINALNGGNGYNYDLISTVGCYQSTNLITPAILKSAAQYIDQINLMTFDIIQGVPNGPGPHAAIHGSYGTPATNPLSYYVNTLISGNIPSNMINIALPTYGKAYGCNGTCTNTTLLEPDLRYSVIKSKIANGTYGTPSDITFAGEVQGTMITGITDPTLQIYYDGPNAALAKANYVIQNNLGGIMIWNQ